MITFYSYKEFLRGDSWQSQKEKQLCDQNNCAAEGGILKSFDVSFFAENFFLSHSYPPIKLYSLWNMLMQ